MKGFKTRIKRFEIKVSRPESYGFEIKVLRPESYGFEINLIMTEWLYEKYIGGDGRFWNLIQKALIQN